MAGRTKFDQEAAFKAIVGETAGDKVQVEQKEKAAGKGRPKVDRETKSRVTLALYSSSYKDLQKIAYVERNSASNIVSEMIAEYVAANAAKLKEYDKIKVE